MRRVATGQLLRQVIGDGTGKKPKERGNCPQDHLSGGLNRC